MLAAVAGAVAGHLGQPGPAPVPGVVAQASPAAHAAEPVCLAFLAAQALQRQDGNAAVRYLEEGLRALPDSTALMLRLASALQARVVSGQSPVEADDLRRIGEMAQAALEQRRRWSGPSAEALAMLIRRCWPEVRITETHPKMLYYACANCASRWETDREVMLQWLSAKLDCRCDAATDHEFDALMSAWAAREGFCGAWRDLRKLSTNDSILEPAGPVHYWWPE